MLFLRYKQSKREPGASPIAAGGQFSLKNVFLVREEVVFFNRTQPDLPLLDELLKHHIATRPNDANLNNCCYSTN